MVGIGEAYLPAFALAVGVGEVSAGLLANFPMLAGALLQLVTPYGVRSLGSHRRWVVSCAILQAFSFVPFVVGALVGEVPTWALFLLAALYWGTGQATAPAWNTWIEKLVPRPIRAHYFARRSRLGQAFVLGGLLTGGFTLAAGHERGHELFAFALLFATAAVARMVSARFLAAQSEEPLSDDDYRGVSVPSLVGRFRHSQDGKLVLYMLSVQVAVHLSAPFFSPFMLSEMALSYDRYMVLITAALLGRIAALPLLGSIAKRFGSGRLLWLGGIGIVPLSAMWIVSQSFVYLVVAQAFAGVAWAAYELATQLLFFEMIRQKERTSLLTLYNVANALALSTGAILGGVMLKTLGHSHDAYMVLFGVSFVARALTMLLLLRVAHMPARLVRLASRIVAVRPSQGLIERPIVTKEIPPRDKP